MSTAFKVIKNFHEKGNTCIGAGMYSAVMESRDTDNIVIKVGSDVNDACLFYYKLIQSKLKNNPYTPRIHSLYICDNYYICKLEKLYENNKNNDKSILRDLSRILDKAIDLGYSKKKLYKKLIKRDLEKYCDSKLFEVISELQKHNNKISSDLGNENILFRDTGQIVLSDPVYTTGDLYSGYSGYCYTNNVIVSKWVTNNIHGLE